MPTDPLYRIMDEPAPGALRSWVVQPLWPWLALLAGGAWIGVPWLVFNSHAIGSPTRVKETVVALLVPVALVAVTFGASLTRVLLDLPDDALPYLRLVPLATKVVLAYMLFIWQARAFELHQHFGGEVRSGVLGVVAAFFLGDRVLAALLDVSPWLLMMGQ